MKRFQIPPNSPMPPRSPQRAHADPDVQRVRCPKCPHCEFCMSSPRDHPGEERGGGLGTRTGAGTEGAGPSSAGSSSSCYGAGVSSYFWGAAPHTWRWRSVPPPGDLDLHVISSRQFGHGLHPSKKVFGNRATVEAIRKGEIRGCRFRGPILTWEWRPQAREWRPILTWEGIRVTPRQHPPNKRHYRYPLALP